MVVLAGCDYLKNVRGLGIITAYKMVAAKDDLFHQLEVKGAPTKYKQNFNDTLAVFSRQPVFDINYVVREETKLVSAIVALISISSS